MRIGLFDQNFINFLREIYDGQIALIAHFGNENRVHSIGNSLNVMSNQAIESNQTFTMQSMLTFPEQCVSDSSTNPLSTIEMS